MALVREVEDVGGGMRYSYLAMGRDVEAMGGGVQLEFVGYSAMATVFL